nr:hypothetical protein [Candidatus Limiplasma sp.]
VCLKMKNFSVRRALAARMDASHANAAAAWEDMDRPEYPDAEQLAKLEAASELRWESVKTENGEIRLTLPPHGVICLNLEKQKRELE